MVAAVDALFVRTRRRAFRTTALVLALAWPEFALAQGETGTDVRPDTASVAAEARIAFDEGLGSIRATRWADAEVALRRSLALVPRQSTRYDLAFVLFVQARFRESWTVLQEFAEEQERFPDPSLGTYGSALAARVKQHIGLVHIAIDPAGADVRIDGERTAPVSSGQAIPLAPGGHRLEGSASGYAPWHLDIAVEAGAEIEEKVVLEPLRLERTSPGIAVVEPPLRRSVETRSGSGTVGPWITMGVGGVLLASAVVTGLLAKRADGDFVQQCPSRTSCPPSLRGLRDDALHLATATDLLLASGVVVVAGGFAWRVLAAPVAGRGEHAVLFTAGVTY